MISTPAFSPVTPDRQNDFETLFGKNGACAGCWCMWWRLTRSQFDALQAEGRKDAMAAIIQSGQAPGILAYVDGQPAGWCAIGPREAYPVLGRSRNLKPVDDRQVWSITCFFVGKPYRRQGLTDALIAAALDFARAGGAQIVEAYPVDREDGTVNLLNDFTGVASTFVKAGFVEVARRAPRRPVMRYSLL